MVRRVFDLMYKEVRGLHQAAYVLALFAFGSQLLALLRDRLLAHQFGAGYELDLYYSAFRIPDLLYVVFASTLSVYVLIPFVTRARETTADDSQAQLLLSRVFSAFLVLYAFLAALVACFAPLITPWLFPGIGHDETLILLLRILLLQPFFLGVSSLFGVVTQLGHRFVLYAISPLIYNLGIIFGIVALEPYLGLPGLAIGVVLGACGHMLIQLPLVRRSSLAFRWTSNWSFSELRDILATSIPRALTLSINQIVLLVFVSLASVMTVGSVSVYQFAYNLQSVPLAIIGVSYSVAAFPILAELAARKETRLFAAHITTAIKHILFWSLPAIALITILRAHIVRVILGTGAFDWSDTRLTAAVLALLSFSLVAQAINLLVVRAFYAGGNTRVPLLTSLVGALLSVGLAVWLLALFQTSLWWQTLVTTLLRVPDVGGAEVLMLALGYSIGVTLQMGWLVYILARTHKIDFSWLPVQLGRSIVAVVFGSLATYGTLQFIVGGINPETFLGILIQGVIAGVMGLVGVVLGYVVTRSPELQEVVASFRRKLFRTDVVAPEQDLLP